MKTCSNCGAPMNDEAKFCIQCGMAASFSQNTEYQQYDQAQQPNNQYNNQGQQQYQYNNQYQQYRRYDPYDHTGEFAPEDVSKNKLFAILIYLASIIGVIVAVLCVGKDESPYIRFHIRQAIKFYIIEAIVTFITVCLSWTIVFLIIGGICLVICLVLNIIAFVWACCGKSKEIPIIRLFGFLK